MKRFKFRLQRVLEYRDELRKEKERELAERNKELHDAEERLTRLRSDHDNSVMRSEAELLSMTEVLQRGEYQHFLQEALKSQSATVKEAQDAVEQARDAYVEKAIDAKTLESLREKKLEQFREEAARVQKKALDQHTVLRYRLTKS